MRLVPALLAMSLLSPAALAQEQKAPEGVTLEPRQALNKPGKERFRSK